MRYKFKGVFCGWLAVDPTPNQNWVNKGWTWKVETPLFKIYWENPSPDEDACFKDATSVCQLLGIKIVDSFWTDYRIVRHGAEDTQRYDDAMKRLKGIFDSEHVLEAPPSFFDSRSNDMI